MAQLSMGLCARRTGGQRMDRRIQRVGYGAEALAALAGVVGDLKSIDPMAPVTVIVSSNAAGIVARRYLARGVGGGRGIAAVEFTTLARLGEQLTAGEPGQQRPATSAVVAAMYRAALTEAPGSLIAVAEHPSTVRAIVQAGSALRDLDEGALSVLAESGTLASDVVRLHRHAWERAAGWCDVAARLDSARAVLGREPTGAARLGTIVIYLPQVFSNKEAAFLQGLTESADWHAVVGLVGDRSADEPVARSLSRAGITIPPGPAVGVPPLDGQIAADRSVGWVELPDIAEGGVGPVGLPAAGFVFHASDSDDEVRWVARQILLRMRKTPGHRIAVLYASREPYARLLHDHFTAAGIAVNGPGVVAIRDRALVRGFLALLNLPRGEFARADVFAAIDQAPIRMADGGRIPAARWERISREAGVVRGDDWELRLSRLVVELEAKAAGLVTSNSLATGDGIGATSDLDGDTHERVARLERRVQSIEELRAFVAELRSELGRGAGLSSWSALSTWAVDLFHRCFGTPEELSGSLPREEQYAAVVLEQTLQRLAELDAVPQAASLSLLRDVLELEFDDARSNVGRFGEGVYLAPISASIGLSGDITYVVGLAEDNFPGRLTPDPILPDSVRRLVPGQLPLARESIADKRRQLLIAFSSAPEVVATFARGDLRRNVGRLPSRWLLPTLRSLGRRPDLAATEWEDARSDAILVAPSHWNEARTTSAPATEQEWRIRAVAAGTLPVDGIIESSLQLLNARAADGLSRFDGDLRGVNGLPDYARDPITVAPTTLEQYAGCPYAYFVRRLLRIQPVELPEEIVTMSPLDSGNLVHESFDRFVRQLTEEGGLPGYGQPWSDADKFLLREIAMEIGDGYAAQGLAGHPRLWARERAAILHDLDLMLAADSEHRAEKSSRVIATEVVFGMRGRRPVEIPIEGGVVHMAGSIDKVDRTRDGRLIVTDIKTGKSASFRGIEDDLVVAGSKLQLPVYVAAAAQEFGLTGDEEIEAEYWFVRRDRGKRISAALDDSRRERYRSAVGTIVGSIAIGLFPAKPPEEPDVMFVRCPYCNADGIGHGESRLRYERKRHDPALASLAALVDPEVAT